MELVSYVKYKFKNEKEFQKFESTDPHLTLGKFKKEIYSIHFSILALWAGSSQDKMEKALEFLNTASQMHQPHQSQVTSFN